MLLLLTIEYDRIVHVQRKAAVQANNNDLSEGRSLVGSTADIASVEGGTTADNPIDNIVVNQNDSIATQARHTKVSRLVHHSTVKMAANFNCSKKRKLGEEESDDGYSTEKEVSKSRKKAAGSQERASKTTVVIRKQTLENDKFTKNVTANAVTCVACNKTIKLDARRQYESTHWDNHRAKCPQITGKTTIRVAKKKRINAVGDKN